MPLERKPKRELRPSPLSFRFSEEARTQLRVLTSVYEQTQIEVLETLLKDAYEEAKKKHPEDVRRAERKK